MFKNDCYMVLYIALLRGINVGGKHKVPMKDLKILLEENGFQNVITLLNSGNIIFTAKEQSIKKLERNLALFLEKHFSFSIPVIVVKATVLQQIIEENPFKKEAIHKGKKFYVSFTKEKINNIADLQTLQDDFFKIIKTDDHCIFSTVDLTLGKTTKAMEKLDKLFDKKITTRNWNTLERIYKKL